MLPNPGDVIGMNARFGNLLRQIQQILSGGIGKGPGKAFIATQYIGLDVPDE
ncbi:hypothetical protein D3C84_1019070 [compost metagenome]